MSVEIDNQDVARWIIESQGGVGFVACHLDRHITDNEPRQHWRDPVVRTEATHPTHWTCGVCMICYEPVVSSWGKGHPLGFLRGKAVDSYTVPDGWGSPGPLSVCPPCQEGLHQVGPATAALIQTMAMARLRLAYGSRAGQ